MSRFGDVTDEDMEWAESVIDTDDIEHDCGLRSDGQCSLAGTEHCDFCCPNRNSDLFVGSEAWRKKHERK